MCKGVKTFYFNGEDSKTKIFFWMIFDDITPEPKNKVREFINTDDSYEREKGESVSNFWPYHGGSRKSRR
jgi:hypothetical protein